MRSLSRCLRRANRPHPRDGEIVPHDNQRREAFGTSTARGTERVENAPEDQIFVGRVELLDDPLGRPALVTSVQRTAATPGCDRAARTHRPRSATARSSRRCTRPAQDPAPATPRVEHRLMEPRAHTSAADPARSCRVEGELGCQCVSGGAERDGGNGFNTKKRSQRRRTKKTGVRIGNCSDTGRVAGHPAGESCGEGYDLEHDLNAFRVRDSHASPHAPRKAARPSGSLFK